MSILITSQHYLNDEIVAAKVASEDFDVQVSPEFEIFGETYRVVLDGNHSLAAALEQGVEPIIIEYDARDHDAVSLLSNGQIDDFLLMTRIDGDYIEAISRRPVAW
jgi:hypothetical protein